MRKYPEEIANHQRYMKLCEEIVLVNERICDLRPAPGVKDDEELSELKKKLQNLFRKKYKTR